MNYSPFRKIAFAVFTLLALASCAQNPVSGRQEFVAMSESEEIQIGRKGAAEVKQEYGTYDMPTLQQYVNQVGQRLAAKSHRPNLDYHFTVVDSPEINAFALPGGYIYITRGILAYLNSEAELAAVLGHEIGHVTARHAVQQYTAATAASVSVAIGSLFIPELRNEGAQNLLNLLGNALISGYGREHELEADRLGAEYLARAGYDSQAMVRVIAILKNQELFDTEIARQEGRQPQHYHGVFATHPDNDTRLQQVVGEANQFLQPGAEEGRNAYLSHLDKVVFGDSPEQGMVRNNVFLHQGLGFALTFPGKWRVQNQPSKLVAQSPSGDAALELRAGKQPDVPPAEFLREALKLDSGGSSIESTTLGSLPAAIAKGTRQGQPLEVSAVYLKQSAYVLIGSAKTPAAFNRYQGEMDSAVRSFRPFSEADRKLARPFMIHTVLAKKDTTFADLARQSPLGKNAEGYLRLMNNAYPSGEPRPGETLKIIQ